jgi:hypothetical protein
VVWRSADHTLYKRTGDASVCAEADYQVVLASLGYPVPRITDRGKAGETCFFIEQAAGQSLHDQAIATADEHGDVPEGIIHAAANISIRLLAAQSRNPLPGSPETLREWFGHAAFAANVFDENPDLDTPSVHAAIEHALDRLQDVPLCRSHMDYGLPNAFPGGVIDWQHHGDAPLGYDVYPMLDIAAFKGGGRGYRFSDAQRADYIAHLDEASVRLIGQRLSSRQGEFLLVKCFFFLALMRPTPPGCDDKHIKWQYRRTLFDMGLKQYESSRSIHTEKFPTLAEFSRKNGQAFSGRPGP